MRINKKSEKLVSAGGLVFRNKDSKREWLLIQPKGTGRWTFPKGKIGDKVAQETEKEAALREVKEEGGVVAEIVFSEPLEINYLYRWQGRLIRKTVKYFVMRYVAGSPHDHDWEVDDARFWEEEKALQLLTFKNEKDVLRKAIALLSRAKT